MSRADRLTPRSKQTEYYSDFLLNFERNPISGEIARVTNERDVIRAMKCLILTGLGERPFELTVGSTISSLMFEPIDDITTDLIKSSITTCIQQHEPRVQLVLVDVAADEDSNCYNVSITFAMTNAPSQVFSFSTVLKRVR